MSAPSRIALPPAAARAMGAAVRAHESGDLAQAEAGYRALTRRYPGFATVWHYLGLLLKQQGQGDEALECLLRAQAMDPDNVTFLLNFGRVLREQGEFARSVACLERAHQLDPDHAQVLVQLTQSMLAVEQGRELLPEIERHLGWAGDDWHLWMLLGECREQTGDRPGALNAFDEAARLAPPGEPRPQLRRGESARRAADPATARTCFERALAIMPDCGEALLGLARLASQEGDFDRVEQLAREALACNPQLYSALDLITSTRRVERGDPLIEELETAAKEAEGNPAAWPLHFARGRVWEKLGDYDRAFGAYELGNRIRSGMRPYSREAQIAHTRDYCESLDEAFTARVEKLALPDPGVIFVCGMPRSGTTLVETILAAHPDVTAGGEIRFVHDLMRRMLGMQGLTHVGTWLRQAPDETLMKIGRDWHRHLLEAAAGRPRLTDKMPGNYSMLGLIHVLFPNAPIVHVHRDPRDNCFSCYVTPFAEGHAFAYRLDDTGHYYRLYEKFMAHWRRVLPPGRILEVEYERLVADPEHEIRRLVEGTGLTWDPRCLNFNETERTVATASLYQVRQPMYSSSVGRWRHFENHLAPLLAELAAPPPF